MALRENQGPLSATQPKGKETQLNILLMLSLAASLALPDAYTIAGALFAVVGLYYLSKRMLKRANILEPNLAGKLPLIFMAFAFICAAVQLWHRAPISHYEMYIPFLWAPLIFVAVLDGRVDRRFLWLGCLLGAIFAGCLSIYQLLHLGIDRPQGFVGSRITFSNIAILLGSVALAGRHDPPLHSRKPLWLALAYFVSLFSLVPSLLSQSKGGWPLFLLVFIWALVEDFRRGSRSHRLPLVFVGLLFVCLMVFMPLDKNMDRIKDATTGAMQWFQTGEIVDSSVGPRLELLKFGIAIWLEKPLLGHGRDGIVAKMYEFTGENKINPKMLEMGLIFLHNEPVQLLAEQGIVGFLSWGMMISASFIVFSHAYLQRNHVQKKLGRAGLMAVLAALIFGSTDMNLMLNAYRQTFVLLIMVITALLVGARKREKLRGS
ncbi:O-antigen ligase family protein [Hoeflea sp.]|uniref:O-antigen ligase family protein n=1 Tax=Hoeflea sp. TaxID=1940281 RepID=UPI003A92401A